MCGGREVTLALLKQNKSQKSYYISVGCKHLEILFELYPPMCHHVTEFPEIYWETPEISVSELVFIFALFFPVNGRELKLTRGGFFGVKQHVYRYEDVHLL